MKKTLCTVLVLVMLLGTLAATAFGADYFESYNVANNYFDFFRSVYVPESLDYYGLCTGDYIPGSSSFGAICSTTVHLDLENSWEDGYAYAMICGNGYVFNDTMVSLEVRDDSSHGVNEELDTVYTWAECTESNKAVKIYHYGTFEDYNGMDRYDATYVCPMYYELYD